MSPLGLLLLSECDIDLRLDLNALSFRLSVLGVSLMDATKVARMLGLCLFHSLN